MSTRISSALVLLLALAACGDRNGRANNRVIAKVEAAQGADAADEGTILCSVGGAATLERQCTVDREQTERGLMLTISQPDGAFHRLLVTTDGRGVVAADGAQPASVTVVGNDEIEVTLAGNHYRLPATVRAKT